MMKNLKIIIIILILISYGKLYSQVWSNDFGNNGIVKLELANRNTRGYELILLNDTSILVGVNSDYSQYGALFDRNFYIYKLNPSGTIDSSFANNGCLFMPSGGYENPSWLFAIVYSEYNNLIYGLARISGHIKLFRFNHSGVIDLSFGINGYVDVFGYHLLVQNDGKSIILGYIFTDPFVYHKITRLNLNGSIDQSFGINGEVIQNLTPLNRDFINDAKLQGDKIVVVGYSWHATEFESFATIARYNNDGYLDNTFGTNGYSLTPIGNENYGRFSSVDIRDNGEIIAAGNQFHSGGTGGLAGAKAILVKYNPNGILENTFSLDGIKILNSINGANEVFYSVKFLGNGDIIAGGWSGEKFPSMQSYYYLARVNPEGEFVNSFFDNGYLITNFDNSLTNLLFNFSVSSNDEIFSTGITRDISDTCFIAVVCKMDNSNLYTTEFEHNIDLKIYPNPFYDYIIVRSKDVIKKIKVFSINGSFILEKEFSNEYSVMIDLMRISDGLYLLEVTNSTGKITKKIVKKS